MPPTPQIPPAPRQSFVGRNYLCPSNESSNKPRVFKIGRSTGSTAGVVNGSRAETRLYDSGTWTVTSTELVIVPSRWHLDVPPPVAGRGDSGALVYDGSAQGALASLGLPTSGSPPFPHL